MKNSNSKLSMQTIIFLGVVLVGALIGFKVSLKAFSEEQERHRVTEPAAKSVDKRNSSTSGPDCTPAFTSSKV